MFLLNEFLLASIIFLDKIGSKDDTKNDASSKEENVSKEGGQKKPVASRPISGTGMPLIIDNCYNRVF